MRKARLCDAVGRDLTEVVPYCIEALVSDLLDQAREDRPVDSLSPVRVALMNQADQATFPGAGRELE